MNKLEIIATAKTFRQELDNILQRMKSHKGVLTSRGAQAQTAEDIAQHGAVKDHQELIAQHILSLRDLESAIMRQGMALKAIGNPTPYPQSYNPASPVVEPTADGLKL